MSHALTQTLPITLISKADYDKYISRWITLLNEDDGKGDMRDYFYKGSFKLSAVHFDVSAIEYLVSSEATATIKARFCITRDDEGEELFNIILFGTDKNEGITTAFFLGTPYAQESGDGVPNGQLPTNLGELWLQKWAVNDDFISRERFRNIFGYLQGYNFPLEDFIDAAFLYKCSGLSVSLALHELYRPNVTDVNAPTFTFNLVLQGILADGENAPARIGNPDGLYDISAPSPPY
ncbi:hypothetical protein [Chitinophaga sancti]|uniref:hypothetical protein n=1 Tax=Chitinophaga sancti TaxID=1004 RepID=UPI003F799697